MTISWGKVIPWLLLGAFILFFIFYLKGCGTPGGNNGAEVDSARFWKNKYGEAVTSLKGTQDQLAQAPQKYRDSIADLLDTKAKLLQEVVELRLKGKVIIYADTGKDKPVLVYADSGKGKQLESATQVFTNPWYVARIQLNLLDGSKSLAEIQTFDSLLLVWKIVRSGGLFNRHDSLQLDVKNSNPFNQITGLKAFRVPAIAQKKFGLGLSIGWGYGFNAVGGTWGYPIIGITLQRTFIHF